MININGNNKLNTFTKNMCVYMYVYIYIFMYIYMCYSQISIQNDRIVIEFLHSGDFERFSLKLRS